MSLKAGFAQIFLLLPKKSELPKIWGGCSPPHPPGPYAYAYEEFHLTRTQGHKGTLTSVLKKREFGESIIHRLFFSLFGCGLFKSGVSISFCTSRYLRVTGGYICRRPKGPSTLGGSGGMLPRKILRF